ncbi:MAG: hypothetical protein Q9182_005683, partial [Xanthomendoza sp. 2 TL-2023]
PLVKDLQGHAVYDYRKSPNSHYIQQAPAPGIAPVNLTFDIGYEFQDSRVQGRVVNEVVSLAGVPSVPMNIEVATEVSDAVKSVKCWDGMIGMGFSGLNTAPRVPPGQETRSTERKTMLTPSSVKPVPQYPYLERLLNESATSPNPPTLPVFTVDGNPKRAGSKPTFEIGRIDREKANGYLQKAAVNNADGWWAVENIIFEAGYDIDHHPGYKIKSKHGMIFVPCVKDTGGSSIISVHNDTAAGYYSLVPKARDLGNNGTYFFPCNSPLPDFKLYIGNGTAVYRASLFPQNPSTVPGICSSMIKATKNQYGNVGGAFFKTHFVVFDYKTPAIQYAPFN